MRTLNKNTTKLWLVNKLDTVEEIDGDGFYTGNMVDTYSEPTVVYINIYPANSDIVERIFGKDVSFDKVAVSNSIVLDENSLLFEEEPIDDFATTYTYRIDSIAKSINTYNYGLRSRT